MTDNRCGEGCQVSSSGPARLYAGKTLNIDTYVIHVNGEVWCLELNGKHLGTFNERAEAEKAAEVAARMSQKRGRAAEILIDDGKSSEE
jgi:hypothetical protein